MNLHRAVVAAAAVVALQGAAPAPIPAAAAEVVSRYVSALAHHAYPAAFALLTARERRYFRSPENFRSVFTADAFAIDRFRLVSAREKQGTVVVLVGERVHYLDLSAAETRVAEAHALYGAVRDPRTWRVSDPGHPWRAFASDAGGAQNGVRLAVRKVSFFTRRVELVIVFTNVGDQFVTFLPYGRTVLKDDRGALFRPIESHDWRLTSRRLFEGLRLAPNAQYTGILNFETPTLDDAPRTFSLTVAPELRDGSDTPFSTTVARIAPRDAAR